VKNPLMLVSAIEMTVFLLFFLRALRRGGVRGTLSLVTRDPALALCVVFVIVFATAVGLATTNLGTLARYRSTMLPFFGVLLFGTTYARLAAKRNAT
jgi:hypothetical protein